MIMLIHSASPAKECEEYDEGLWKDLFHSKEYSTLVKAKRLFIVPVLIFFSLFFVSLLVIQGYYPIFASTAVVGAFNVSYLYTVSLFPIAWILCYLYIRYSRKVLDSFKHDFKKEMNMIRKPSSAGMEAREGIL